MIDRVFPYYFDQTGIRFLARHEFCDSEPAPISSPHDGLIIIDVENKLSISDGVMNIAAQTTPVDGDLGFPSVDAYARKEGVAVFYGINFSTVDDMALGFLDAQDALRTSYDNIGISINGTALEARYTSDADSPDLYTLAPATDYVIAEILRDAGRYIYLFDGTDWLLLWEDEEDSTATLYIGLANLIGVAALTYVRPAQLFPTLLKPPVSIVGAVPASTSGNVADSDQFGEATLASLTSEIRFRVQDATNYWAIEVDGAGTITLEEYVAGVPTTRITDAAGLTGTETIRWLARGTTIEVWHGNTSAGSYPSANNFLTEKGYEVPNAGDWINLSIWEASAPDALAKQFNQANVDFSCGDAFDEGFDEGFA